MLRNKLDTTSKIHQKLKTTSNAIRVYSDGIAMDGLGSIRLSNIPNNLQCNLISSLKILLLLISYADAATHLMSSQDNKNHYELYDGIGLDQLDSCGTIISDQDYSAKERAFHLKAQTGDDYAALYRVAGEPINGEIEHCLFNVIRSQINEMEDHDILITSLIAILSIIVIMMISIWIDVHVFGLEEPPQHQERDRLLINIRNHQFFLNSSEPSTFLIQIFYNSGN